MLFLFLSMFNANVHSLYHIVCSFGTSILLVCGAFIFVFLNVETNDSVGMFKAQLTKHELTKHELTKHEVTKHELW